MTPRGVILDYGGVLSLEPSAASLERLHALCGLEAPRFAAAWLEHRHGYDLGELSAVDYWERVTGRRYDDDGLAEVVGADVESWAATNEAMVAWVHALKAAGLRVGLLSNMPREHWLAFERLHAWLDACDAITVSWEHGLVKPDAAIYRLCLDGLGLAPGEALFVDDRPDNVEAAARLGLHALRFTGVAELRDELVARFDGALPLPDPRR